MIRTICLAAALLAAACTRPTDDLEHRLDEALKGRRARDRRRRPHTRRPHDPPRRRSAAAAERLQGSRGAGRPRPCRTRTHAPFGSVRRRSRTARRQYVQPDARLAPPEGGTVTLAGLIRYSISLSDNIACDRLLDFAGGPAAVEEYLRGAGIGGFRIAASERTMHRATENQRLNTAPPSAVCELFARLLRGGLLPAEYDALLRSALEEAPTGANQAPCRDARQRPPRPQDRLLGPHGRRRAHRRQRRGLRPAARRPELLCRGLRHRLPRDGRNECSHRRRDLPCGLRMFHPKRPVTK